MATDDSDDNDGTGGTDKDEPRAKDLLTRPREELEKELDPATLAQLSSWFEMPNLADREEEEAVAEEIDSLEREREAMRKRREAACAAVDPALVRHIERRERVHPGVMPAFDLVPFIDDSIVNRAVRAQLERQSAEEPIADMREYDQPHDVEDIVRKQSAPQAILRDLFRPVAEFGPRYESPFDELPDMDPCREAREVMSKKVEIEWTENTLRLAAMARAEGKALLRESWPAYVEAIQALKKERGY